MPSNKNGIHAAFVKAQAEMTNPKKTAENPFFKSKYADLTSCWLACKDALANNSIGVMQGVHGDRLRTTLVHTSGEMMADDGIPLGSWENTKNPAQELQKNITYARRGGLCSMLGMAPEDDDGNSLTQDTTPANGQEKKWHGPLNKTKLNEAGKQFNAAMKEAKTIEEFKTVLVDHMETTDQLQLDYPQWWFGDGGDITGYRLDIKERREALEAEQRKD